MKLRTCLAVVLAVGLLVGAFAASGYADCVKTLKVVAVVSESASTHFVYGVDLYQVLPGYYYFWAIDTTNEYVLNAAQAAATSGRIATIQGNAATCPTTGIARYGGAAFGIIILR